MNKLFFVALLSAFALTSSVGAMDSVDQMNDEQFDNVLSGAIDHMRLQRQLASATQQSNGNRQVGPSRSNPSPAKQTSSRRVQGVWQVRQ